MVSISVLAMLGGLVAQLMSSTSKLTSNSKQSSEADTEARYALSQISADLGRRVRRPDVDALVKKLDGNDEFFFFSETSGYAPNLTDSSDPSKPSNRSTVSLLGYRIQKVQKGVFQVYELQRYARALPWVSSDQDKAMPFIILTGSPAVPLPSSTLAGNDGKGTEGSYPKAVGGDSSEDRFFQPIAENVVRFEVSVLQKPAKDPKDSSKYLAANLLSDDQVRTELSANGFTNISAIVVSLAIVDTQCATKLTPQDIDALNLTNSSSRDWPMYPVEKWNAAFKQNITSLPKYMRSGVHYYQRVIGL
jgi:hypothetical protein